MKKRGKGEGITMRNSVEKDKQEKRPYHAPELFLYGKLRDLTLAPSPGTFESGFGAGFKG